MSSPNDKNSAMFGYNNGFGYGASGFGYGMAPQQMVQQPMQYIHQPHIHLPGPYRPMNHHAHVPHPQIPPQSSSPQHQPAPQSPTPQNPGNNNSGNASNPNLPNNNSNSKSPVSLNPGKGSTKEGDDPTNKGGNPNTTTAQPPSSSTPTSSSAPPRENLEGSAGETHEGAEGHAESGAGEGEGDGNPEEEEVSIKILVPNNMVGSIIGKGGATIKEITVQTKAKIHIAQGDDSSLERVVTITGTLPSVSQAQYQISLKMQDESYSEIKDFVSDVPPGKRMSLIPMKLLVPNAVVGRLIGKGGANLKKTMAETDTFITCSKEDEITRFTGDRIVSVVGNVENQTKAQNSVTQQVKLYLQSQAPAAAATAPMLNPKDKGPIHYDQNFVAGLIRNGPRGIENFPSYPFPRAVPIPAYQPLPIQLRMTPELQDHEETVVVQVPNGVVGSIIGKGGATIKDIASRSRTIIRVARNDEVDANAANRAISISGTLESIFKAQSLIFAKIAEAPPAIGGGDQPFRVELTIPNEMVGRIIGKKGSQVKKITEVSGARLTINQEEPNEESGEQSSNTIVTVSGRLDSNLMAQHMIQEILYYHQNPQE